MLFFISKWTLDTICNIFSKITPKGCGVTGDYFKLTYFEPIIFRIKALLVFKKHCVSFRFKFVTFNNE